MWADWHAPALRGKHEIARPYLRFDDGIWDELIPAMRDAGVTSVLLEMLREARRAAARLGVIRGSSGPTK
jgi:hypothetical protein